MLPAMAVDRGTPGNPFSSGLFAMVRSVMAGPRTTAEVKARIKGYLGDHRVGRTLRDLPGGWRVYEDVGVEAGIVDFVAAGPRGVFAVAVMVDAGAVVATTRGLYLNGKRNNRFVQRALGQAAALEQALGVEVTPVLAVVGSNLTGREVDKLPLVLLEELPAFLLNYDGRRLAWEEAKRILDVLGATTR